MSVYIEISEGRIPSADAIQEEVFRWLDEHAINNLGSIHQDPYKSDLFSLCITALEAGYMESTFSPRLTREAMAETLASRGWKIYDWSRIEYVNYAFTMWEEWSYVLEKMRANPK